MAVGDIKINKSILFISSCNAEQEVLGRTNRPLSFDTTCNA
jgi:hypothetical protein